MATKADHIDRTTRKWIKCPADEIAARNGCRFRPELGEFVIRWIESYCRLYEGELAGQPMLLKDWQRDVAMRLFSWVKHSEKWGREVRRFRSAAIYIPKKNGKSPTLAAIGLYLLCGDGEPGQKVYFAAKDGSQAREIAAKHAIEMMNACPELADVCTVNKTTAQITHEETRSIMKPLSSSNATTQKSKEGLNGSVLVDETHVVDGAFMDRVDRAGISRSEPLHLEVSTAGSDPESYGKTRFDYALKVQAGEIEDEQLFVAIYAAPQDLTDEQLDANPLKWGKLANPTMGRLIDPAEFMADYRRSKAKGPLALANFKMYRLNIWQNAANAWLDMGNWRACGDSDIDEATLEGRDCFAGLDLAAIHDAAGYVLAFPPIDQGDPMIVIPRIFIPADSAMERERQGDAPWESWIRQGFVIGTLGATIDYRVIAAKLFDDAKRFNIRKTAVDRYYIELFRQHLKDDGDELHMVAHGQGSYSMTPAMQEVERLVQSKTMRHPANPCMDWMAGNTTAKMDHSGSIRPVKGRSSAKKIDAIVAMIMAVGTAAQSDDSDRFVSVYETTGIETL
jgi:phage terminase large subunit-like protein